LALYKSFLLLFEIKFGVGSKQRISEVTTLSLPSCTIRPTYSSRAYGVRGLWRGLLKKKNLNERGGVIGQGQRQGRRMGMNENGQDEQVRVVAV